MLVTLKKLSLIIFIAFVLGYISIWLSNYYQFYDGFVSWYFPHGVRVAALFFLPFKYWCVFLFFSIIGSDTYYHINMSNEEGIGLDTIKTFLAYYLIELLTGGLVYYFYKKFVDNVFSITGVFWITILSIAYRLTYLGPLAYFKSGFFGLMPEEVFTELFVAIQMAGYTVGLLCIGFLLIFLRWKAVDARPNSTELIKITGLGIATAALLYISLLLSPDLDYLLRIILVIPIFLVAYRFGWFGAMIYSYTLVITTILYLFGAPSEDLIDYQPFVLSYLLIGMFASAVLYEHDMAQNKMQLAQSLVTEKNAEISAILAKVQNLTIKILDAQEQERKYLSHELHDEIGQNLIALKSAVHLLQMNPNDLDQVIKLREQLDITYQSAYELMHWLRPNTLDQFGLVATLQGEYFSEKLALSDIKYQPNINLFESPPAYVETALFRIVQEAVTNTIKHSNATYFSVVMSERESDIRLSIHDDGDDESVLDVPSSGIGLESMYERIIHLDGTCVFSKKDGFRIEIVIPKNW